VIRQADVMPLLLDACPSFAPVWDRIEEENLYEGRRLSYLDASEFLRHLVSLWVSGSTDDYPSVFRTIERLVVEGDEYVSELAVIGLLEGLQMCTVTEAGIDPVEVFEPLLGPVSRRWWVRLDRFWAGEHDALQVKEP
jgi:hypothetical protein